ncbi:MAG: aminotransferase class I/II-fold pyridoxal phosphate-dependent enzyme, partial [Myxococcota bacterium]
MQADVFKAMVGEAATAIVQHLAQVDQRPVWKPVRSRVESLDRPRSGLQIESLHQRQDLPAKGASMDVILSELFDDVLSPGLQTRSAGYMAYMPSGGLLSSAVADLIASAVNRYVGNWAASPGLVELETKVIQWFAKMVGYPPSSRGYLASGGSMANISAILCARRFGAHRSLSKARAYGSSFTHHSLRKALMMAGFADDVFVEVQTDACGALSTSALRAQIEADRAAGYEPLLILATAGSTMTGAIDPMSELASLAMATGLWLHVDAAYGGFFALTQRGQAALRGLDRAHSITLDPHKSLFIPYGTGALLVREGEQLRRAHQGTGDRYSPRQDSDERIDFCEHSPELSRSCRGLRVWLPLKLHGQDAFTSCLDEKLDLARWLAGELAQLSDVELPFSPSLTVVVFRWAPSGYDSNQLDDLNRAVLERINERGRIHLMGV